MLLIIFGNYIKVYLEDYFILKNVVDVGIMFCVRRIGDMVVREGKICLNLVYEKRKKLGTERLKVVCCFVKSV